MYRWAGAGPARLVTVLYPTPAGVACPVRAVEADDDVDATAVRLRLADGRALWLDERDWPA